jgi:hypothetical protein
VRLRRGNNAELQLSSYVVAAVQLAGRDSKETEEVSWRRHVFIAPT